MPMPLEHERAFSAESPVGRYWLRNCVGFRVEGFRGRPGIVEEIGLGPDGVDVLAVRRGLPLAGVALVPTHRVESVHPWDDTIVLGSRRTPRPMSRSVPDAQKVARALGPVGRTVAVETARAIRDGATLVLRVLAALGTLLFGLTVLVREHVSPIARAYAGEARHAWRAERDAIAAWRESRRERAEEPGDDGPLTRAAVDDVDARPRDTSRRR
jgi:hypothetical protein